jgi:hypothetical protein
MWAHCLRWTLQLRRLQRQCRLLWKRFDHRRLCWLDSKHIGIFWRNSRDKNLWVIKFKNFITCHQCLLDCNARLAPHSREKKNRRRVFTQLDTEAILIAFVVKLNSDHRFYKLKNIFLFLVFRIGLTRLSTTVKVLIL